jgi:tetratricopeptide (TPR) repeat protein
MDIFEEIERHLEQGKSFKSFGEYQSAIAAFENAVRLNPLDPVAYMELGLLSFGYEKDLPKAKRHLEAALDINDLLPDAHMYLGVVLNRLGEKERAENHFRKSINTSYDPALAHAVYAEEFLWHNSRFGEAEEHFKAALSIDPNCVMAMRDYARMLVCHGRDLVAALMFHKALSIDPRNKFSLKEKALFDETLNDKRRDPLERLRRAVNRDPNYSEGTRILRELLKNKKGDETIVL